MNDELPGKKQTERTLEERFADSPATYARLHEIADMMEEAIARGSTADEAEAEAMEQIRKLGGDLLSDWARQKQEASVAAARAREPGAIKHIKKKSDG